MADQITLGELKPAEGSHKGAKRVGRGNGSGHGTFSGNGCKGTKARSGTSRMRLGFEGGQMPIQRRTPARGFRNPSKKSFQLVNVGDISARVPGDRVDAVVLHAAGLIRTAGGPVKILGDGELNRAVTVVADSFSRVAREKIAAAGGTAEERTGA
jgi:large subunit ribosomal protein L15